MINFDNVTKENMKIRNLINQKSYSSMQTINGWRNWVQKKKFILWVNKSAKDTYEAKYQFSINTRESTSLKYLNDSKAFIEYPNDMDDIYKNVKEYHPNKNRKILTVSHGTIPDIISHKKLKATVTELFNRRRKLDISLVFVTESYFAVPKKN